MSFIITHRYFNIGATALYYTDGQSIINASLIVGLLGVIFALGFLTPITGILLSIAIGIVDSNYSLYNLSSSFLILIILILSFSQSSKFYSLDRQLGIKRRFQRLYCSIQASNLAETKRLYFLGFLIFSLVNLSASVGHFLDPYWMSFEVMSLSLKNSFYSRYFDVFSIIQESYPALFRMFCIKIEIFQLIFQVFMFPLVFNKWGRKFVIFWGGSFFLMSFILFQLSYLPLLEVLFWFLIFGSYSKENSRSKIRLQKIKFFDGYIVSFIFVFCVASGSIAGKLIHNKVTGKKYDNLTQANKDLPIYIKQLLYISKFGGLLTPNVFNTPDIVASKLYTYIEFKTKSKKWLLVPFVAKDGSRMHFHNSDLIYYQLSIPYRRCLQNEPASRCGKYLYKVAEYHYNLNKLKEVVQYRFTKFDNGSIEEVGSVSLD